MRHAPLLFSLMLAVPAAAQDDHQFFQPSTTQVDSSVAVPSGPDSVVPGTVVVHESGSIKALMDEYASKRQPMAGYRVQIYLGDRSTAETVRRSFLQQHPETPAYLSYLAPNFRVRVGDLRDRVSAEFLRESLKSEFPGLYIVPDEIEPPTLQNGGD